MTALSCPMLLYPLFLFRCLQYLSSLNLVNRHIRNIRSILLLFSDTTGSLRTTTVEDVKRVYYSPPKAAISDAAKPLWESIINFLLLAKTPQPPDNN